MTGLIDERYASPATAAALPLHPTGTHGEFVAGVRYRAWQPPRCLHPTIPVHTPLVFDLVDLADEAFSSAAARITWRTPAAGATRPFR